MSTQTMPSVRAKIDRMVDRPDSSVKAYASATIGGAYAIHGITVRENDRGLFVTMPSTKFTRNGQTEYSDTFHPVTGEAREALHNAVLEAYEQQLGQTDAPANTPMEQTM